MIVLEGKLTHIIFPSLCNVVVRNVIVLVLEGKLTHVIFLSLWNVFDFNVVVPIGKLTRFSFHSHAMLLLEIPLWFF